MSKNFIPLALDTYFRGNSQEVEFCEKVRAGGNHLIVASAAGDTVGKGDLRLREKELKGALEEYRRLPKDQRLPVLEDPAEAKPPRRPIPEPPKNGLIVRGYCTYLRSDEKGRPVRSTEYYYKENPDRWKAETQSDFLWLTEAEWKSLVPAEPKPGDAAEVAGPIQRRFYSTIAIDYMEGSVGSLPVRDSSMTLTVERVDDGLIAMRLDGQAQLGKEFDAKADRKLPHTRGSEVRVLGYVHYDRKKQAIVRFDVVGVGKAWGNQATYINREVRITEYPWMYGIAWELVTGNSPADRIPPYNMVHYGSERYFEK